MFLDFDYYSYRYWAYAALAVLLALHLWAAYNVVQSPVARRLKTLWVSLLVLFPLLGFFNWYVMGPRAQSR
ncbi:PLDc N-terminal domain-containing protein [Pseudomonas sp. GV071]|jgi:drug/metabolite transporter (DMT)-like permease|uniref:PLDc N-terminal domain-containing protein n=1 Tax=Pseudomonas sp. GV071 TaxID=2135754 RepID=UPI000D34AF6F|nr:PLDc N-terminal domain-containing protein [Pseudomonas sp. GV071]PTQ69451.1 phospholipase D-like protein [Pseudomonas sp. GV071]